MPSMISAEGLESARTLHQARTSTNRRSDRSMLQSHPTASASPLERSEAMFDSIKNWLSRTDRHQADRQKLEAEAKDFRLSSETLPQIFKFLFFPGLGFLNYRLFSHAVPGLWGQATGCVAVMAEAIALYSAHNFSRSAGLFRLSLGESGAVLMAFIRRPTSRRTGSRRRDAATGLSWTDHAGGRRRRAESRSARSAAGAN